MKTCKRGHDWDSERYKQCNICQQISNTKARKKWRNNNLEKARKYAREWSQNHPKQVESSRIRYRYGLEPEQYEAMRLNQKDICAICKTKSIEAIDHCHKQEQVRGLLCRTCNLMLGYAKDNPEILRLGAEYLEDKQ